ncbi:hypothetical protein C3B58_20760 [Lactonifactor longoviformis]|uniref:Uncharacterized protein n=1 Tax=Lactonifactor longoviformis DSM 17459 TaxID=1122155 RepID=A0A1M4VGV4_9CLOT|nr:hypothetical protein [Lactonifactor longoviformis]POP30541.1 hypothetical protein C3B58_20760 [Lactonifactor longoviformis]SHE68264.1 hypothetical protein SAMN02745158_01226 [Lactonifactor longoviformis DSM 17459]
MEEHVHDKDNEYTLTFDSKCPADASKVLHTVIYKKATCTRVDDIILHFHCSRDSKCVKCQHNYL